jgi:hypothetical protein
MTAMTYANSMLQEGLENRCYGDYQRPWLKKRFCILGAESADCQTQNSPPPPKKKRSAVLLQRSETGDAFLSKMITGDETWVHHYNPLTIRQRNCIVSHRDARKKFKMQTSGGKVMAGGF